MTAGTWVLARDFGAPDVDVFCFFSSHFLEWHQRLSERLMWSIHEVMRGTIITHIAGKSKWDSVLLCKDEVVPLSLDTKIDHCCCPGVNNIEHKISQRHKHGELMLFNPVAKEWEPKQICHCQRSLHKKKEDCQLLWFKDGSWLTTVKKEIFL